MGKAQPLPILITSGGRRTGLALVQHLISQRQLAIVNYRTHYPAIDRLIEASAQCTQTDLSTNDGMMAFADEVLKNTHSLHAILHNASAWVAKKPDTPLADVLACIVQIHVNTPYLLNHALERLLRGYGHAVSDIIHSTGYMVRHGNDKHVAYAAGKVTPGNMIRPFARELVPEVKVNFIAPSLILSNECDDAEYRQQAPNRSLTKTTPDEKKVIDLVGYLFTSCFITGRSLLSDGGRHLR